jgi:hypothetical protein
MTCCDPRSSLSAPRATICNVSSGNGRCNALPHPTTRASKRCIPLALSGSPASPSDGAARPLRSRPSSGSHRPGEGRGSALTWGHVAPELGPEAAEGEQRRILIEREPNHILLFGLGVRLRGILRKAIRREEAPAFRFEPAPPMR